MKDIVLAAKAVTDPSCGMVIDPATAAQQRTREGTTFYFCSDLCAEQFDQDADLPAASHHHPGGCGPTPDSRAPAQVELEVGGLTCASCTLTVEHSLRALPGVQQAQVNYALGTAQVSYDPVQVDVAQMVDAVTRAGYSARTAEPLAQTEATDDEETAAHGREYRSLMRKFWFAAVVAIPVMLVAYPELPWLYLPNLFVKQISESAIWWLFVLSGLVTLPVML
jgi:copper chaperone CopZ/YHS domain-containing protein